MYVNYRSATSFLKPWCSDSNILWYQILSKNHLPDALGVAHCLLSTCTCLQADRTARAVQRKGAEAKVLQLFEGFPGEINLAFWHGFCHSSERKGGLYLCCRRGCMRVHSTNECSHNVLAYVLRVLPAAAYVYSIYVGGSGWARLCVLGYQTHFFPWLYFLHRLYLCCISLWILQHGVTVCLGMPSSAVGETMRMFDILADALAVHQLKITDVMVRAVSLPSVLFPLPCLCFTPVTGCVIIKGGAARGSEGKARKNMQRHKCLMLLSTLMFYYTIQCKKRSFIFGTSFLNT